MKTNILQETIKRVLREENSLLTMIRRRVPHDDLEREFTESLDMSSNMLVNIKKSDGVTMKLQRFINATISILMDGIHYEIYSTMPEDSEWYQDVKESLENHFKHRIGVRYDQLIKRL